MIVYPNAKINLGLNVVARREDGFHDIETVFYPIPIRDILEIKENSLSETSFTSSGIEIPTSLKGNLVVQAHQLLKEKYDIPNVDIHLHKIIPIGGGLGGGSSDASFALRLMNELFSLNINNEELETLSSKLGSDCPFFIKNKPVFAEGKGDVFTKVSVSLKGKILVIVNPEIHVSSATAYEGVLPRRTNQSLPEILSTPFDTWKNKLHNDFEKSVFTEHPRIEKLKLLLYENGASYASMSGSGSVVFGIFNSILDTPKEISYPTWSVELD